MLTGEASALYLAYRHSGRLASLTLRGAVSAHDYNALGNRLTQGGTTSSTFTISSANNRLSGVSGGLSRSYSYDGAGHVTGDGTNTFAYNGAGRLAGLSGGVSATYSYNALGQRVRKTVGSTTIYFAYDEAGHILGEYDGSGDLIQEIVWLDDIPVASIRPDGLGGIGFFYIHTDQLNAPRKLTRPSDNTVVWRWDSDPFGVGAPDQDPDGNSLFVVFNLRFPGQYFDAETGTSYNYFRDYDSAVGRYIESDPIGLNGGINTFAYVGGSPLLHADPYGLTDLIYNNMNHTLTIVEGTGAIVGTYPAFNNAQSKSNGPWAAGTYNFSHHNPHPESGPDDKYGSNGIFVFNTPQRTGMGVHSGRANRPDLAGRKGPQAATDGCVRTTDEATAKIKWLADNGDPVNTIRIER